MGNKFKEFLKTLGPGVITGAADDDPSGIATYSQAGAQFGLHAAWVNIYVLPLQIAVQEACARIGAVTGKGITAVIKQNYSRKVVWVTVMLLVVANTINIGADIGAMAEALNLVLPFNFIIYALFFTALTLILEIFTSYKMYAKVLKYLALSLLLYPITLILVSKDQGMQLLRFTFTPWIEWNPQFFFILTGMIGTTISPYMFFWQASEEVEEERAAHMIVNGTPKINNRFISHLRTDNIVGMVMSAIGAWSIVALTALVLFPHGLTDIKTATDAAKALEPLVSNFPNAGYIAKLLFAGGIISLGLLGVPVLAGSAAYAVSEAFGFREGLNLKLKRAHGFYGIITIATLIGLCINFLGIDPMKALIYTAVINGLAAIPLLIVISKVAASEIIMAEYRSGWISRLLLNITIGVMGVGAVGAIWAILG